MEAIRKVGVIGAGTMGAGIAAQVANAGVPVLLLDIVPDGAAARNVLAESAVARMLKAEPAAFMQTRAARLVETGNIEDDIGKLAGCDWIIEAVVERLDAKQALYRRIDRVRRPGTAVSSNTSTIPLRTLVAGMPEAFARDFLITHFFNPPRYMRLLEIVAGAAADPATVDAVAAFADVALGKSIVRCEDSPGFIANRLGIYWMQRAVHEAVAIGLTVEEADAVMGRPLGIPKTGVFGLLDLVGIDLGPHVNASMRSALPPDDPFHEIAGDLPLIARMIAQGLTGRKGKGGFYRIQRQGSDRVKETIDLATGEYRPERRAELPEIKAAGRDLRALLSGPSRAGRYARRVLGSTLAYAATLIPGAAADVVSIDAAMRLGYNWNFGPFELIDRIGAPALVTMLAQEGIAVPALLRDLGEGRFYRTEAGRRQFRGLDGTYRDIVRPAGVLLLEDIKRAGKPVLHNASAALWDIGDGVACFEFTGKSNALDDQVIALLVRTIETVKEKFRALVIYNEAANFSLGANLGLALFAANIAAWGEIEKSVTAGQQAYKALKYAPFPVVAAPAGMALGGGCEILLHSDAVQAHAETYAGLVECGVGLIPGWGGCGEMLARVRADARLPHGPMPAPGRVFEVVSVATVAKSAHEAREKKFMREGDGITMNRDRLLADAKARALAMVDGYAPPAPPEFVLPGPSGRLALDMAAQSFHRRGLATDHDLVVADGLAEVLSGGDTDLTDTMTEQQLLDLERRVFMRLVRKPATLARIEHTLETGKPLRN
ncbi:MAG TPA: 3-hydroxyacyl-CoA dehydrogenase NAD-binding domain-containing protein [Acetobacteraceae bacterium]|nr:3-hydroxyacyl-CoA dehydrogenase NAD-binding domain-containing protein [Acetobacteraceae bacterium]